MRDKSQRKTRPRSQDILSIRDKYWHESFDSLKVVVLDELTTELEIKNRNASVLASSNT